MSLTEEVKQDQEKEKIKRVHEKILKLVINLVEEHSPEEIFKGFVNAAFYTACYNFESSEEEIANMIQNILMEALTNYKINFGPGPDDPV